VKVVVCSGYNVNEFATRFGGGLVPAAFLRKPYMPTDLIERLRQALVAAAS
jgi:hypothetical protein